MASACKHCGAVLETEEYNAHQCEQQPAQQYQAAPTPLDDPTTATEPNLEILIRAYDSLEKRVVNLFTRIETLEGLDSKILSLTDTIEGFDRRTEEWLAVLETPVEVIPEAIPDTPEPTPDTPEPEVRDKHKKRRH